MSSFKLSLTLDTGNKVFRPGGSISGKVTITCLNDKVTFEHISVQFVGEAKVNFSKRFGRGSHDYSADQVLLKETLTLANYSGDHLNLPKLYNTDHQFSFALPPKLPSSSQRENGKVEYYAVARIKEDGKSGITFSEQKSFTVAEILNLNDVPNATLPYAVALDKELFGFIRSKGFVHCRINMPKSGYTIGEKVQLVVEIDNKSKLLVSTSVTLSQKVDFVATRTYSNYNRGTHMKTSTLLVNALAGPKVGAGENLHWIVDDLILKELPVSTIGYDGIIIVRYELEVQIRPPGSRDELSREIPIIIGTVPVTQGSLNRKSDGSNVYCKPSAPMFSDYSVRPPPSYEEATK